MTTHISPPFCNHFKGRKHTCIQFEWSDSTLYRRIQQGVFVPPVSLGPRKSGWPVQELDELAKAMIKGFSKDQLKELVNDLLARRANIELGIREGSQHGS